MRLLTITLAAIIGLASLVPAQNLQKLTLRHGQQKAFSGRLNIKFLAVTEDSRCPTNVNCIWAGVARVKITLRKNGKTAAFELNTNQLDKPAVFEGYEVRLDTLTPYPNSASPTRAADYKALFTISRKGK